FALATNYGPSYGSAEETFGQVMARDLHHYRDEMFIATKAGYDMWPGPYGIWNSRKSLMASLDQSLRRMNLDYVDLFYSHRYDPETPIEETLQAMVDIVRMGKALYVGLSKWPAEEAAKAYAYLRQRDVPCLVYQGRYNMFDRGVETSGVLAQAKEQGAGFVAFSPLEMGILTNRYLNGIPADSRAASSSRFLKPEKLTPELLDRVRQLNDLAAQRGQTLAEMALAWLLKDGMVTSVIVGASSCEQLADSIKCVSNTSFTAEELAIIDRLTKGSL
ncbi:MAG: aldo/keto reductase, partial [Muribaculaceae bacterium]|nr:aldo/keto reductase [Muribaculaceae bacterium]